MVLPLAGSSGRTVEGAVVVEHLLFEGGDSGDHSIGLGAGKLSQQLGRPHVEVL